MAAALTGCTLGAGNAGGQAPPSNPAPFINGTTESSSLPAPGSDYVDGQYTAEGQYGSLPSIGVTVTLAGDVITDVRVTPHATNPTSLHLQNRFAAAVKDVVVGRDIDEIEVDRIAGSSHTPEGFNAALERIKADAAQRQEQ